MLKAIHTKLFIMLSLAFIGATVVGTISHELGHYLFAKKYGFTARVSYGYTYWSDPVKDDSIAAIKLRYQREIGNDETFVLKETYDRLTNEYRRKLFWITIGGPLQTLLTGSIGLLFLFAYKRSFTKKQSLVFWQWLLIFLALFWLRELANLAVWFGDFLIHAKFSTRVDEIRIAEHFKLPYWSIICITGVIGAFVLYIIIFKFIPAKQRITFIIAGLFGGIAGYVLWFMFVGPFVMPR